METLQLSKISNAPKYDSLVISFLHLKLEKDHKQDHMKVVDSKSVWGG